MGATVTHVKTLNLTETETHATCPPSLPVYLCLPTCTCPVHSPLSTLPSCRPLSLTGRVEISSCPLQLFLQTEPSRKPSPNPLQSLLSSRQRHQRPPSAFQPVPVGFFHPRLTSRESCRPRPSMLAQVAVDPQSRNLGAVTILTNRALLRTSLPSPSTVNAHGSSFVIIPQILTTPSWQTLLRYHAPPRLRVLFRPLTTD